MKNYLVRWEIECDADSPLEAARMAREIQLDPNNIATVFEVYEQRDVTWETIDLADHFRR